jgi:indole-3-glycerol phosphate synthase
MSTYLDRIMSQTSLSLLERRAAADISQLEQRAAAHRPRGFQASLRAAATSRPAMIAELKKASPSKGLLRDDYRPVTIAKSYEAVGAAAISVLTNEEFFQGSLADLSAVSDAVRIPVLQKDFILDPFQMLEARAHGADAILLIVASHTDANLKQLVKAAGAMELEVLCEVHVRDELERAVQLGVEVIGVNCRDLTTMQLNPQIHDEMAQWMPANALRVAESGIRTPEDIARLTAHGYNAFLIGETLMRQPDPAAMLAQLMDKNYVSSR